MLRDIYLRSKHNLDVALHTVRAFLFFVFFFGGGGVNVNVFSAYLSSLIFGLPFKLWYG